MENKIVLNFIDLMQQSSLEIDKYDNIGFVYFSIFVSANKNNSLYLILTTKH